MTAPTHRAGIRAAAAAGLALIGAASALNRRARRRMAASTPAGGGPPFEAQSTAAQRRIGILSDSHANGRNSWWRQTVLAGTVPGLRPGPFESHPGAQTGGLLDRLDAAANGADLVIVQAGTNDLLRGRSPAEAAEGVRALWEGIAARGASPIGALIPPSDTRGALAVELNRLLAEAAAARGIPVIDVYSAVAAEDGSWAAGLTNDGIHSNRRGSDLMAEAARGQLAGL
jgi:hypothetical protein